MTKMTHQTPQHLSIVFPQATQSQKWHETWIINMLDQHKQELTKENYEQPKQN